MTTTTLARFLAWLITAVLVGFILASFVFIGWIVYLVGSRARREINDGLAKKA